MKYSERDELVEGLEKVLEFLKTDKALALPSLRIHMDEYLSEYGWVEQPDGTKEYTVLADKTLAAAKRVARALPAPFNKEYSDYGSFSIKKKWSNLVTSTFTVNRETVCRKVVKGTKEVPEHVIPARTEEIVEWVCDNNTLLV
jgi:hypothetical protein